MNETTHAGLPEATFRDLVAQVLHADRRGDPERAVARLIATAAHCCTPEQARELREALTTQRKAAPLKVDYGRVAMRAHLEEAVNHRELEEASAVALAREKAIVAKLNRWRGTS